MKKVGYGVIAALSLVGLLALGRAGMQAYEDYSNFRKIVIWVAQKQAQEAEYARRQAAKQQQTITGVGADAQAVPAVPK